MRNRHALNVLKKREPWYRYYKVLKSGTLVTEVFTNDFKQFKSTLIKIKAACALHSCKRQAFFLPEDNLMFRGFLSRIQTMEYAKAGALKYIAGLIACGDQAAGKLLDYREAHYDDLNFNLTERNIRNLERALKP